MHISKKKRAKLDAVFYQGIFLGYHFTCQYHVYDSQSQKIEWPTSVKFVEHIPGGKLLTDGKFDASTGFSYDDNNSDGNKTPEQVGEEISVCELVRDSIHSPVRINNKNNKNNTDMSQSACRHSTVSTPLLLLENTQNKSEHPSLIPPSRRSEYIQKPYNKHKFDKEKGHAAIEKALDSNGRKETFQLPELFEPQSYNEAMSCQD